MNLRFLAGTAGALMLAGPCLAFSEDPNAYSHALSVTTSGKNAVVQLRLPPAVYLNARTPALDDLRLFNAAGQPLPFAIIRPAAQSATSRRQLKVRVFQVPASAGQDGKPFHDVEIKTSSDGNVTSVTARSGQRARPGPGHSALIFDLGQATPVPIDTLRFALPSGAANYSARVELEASDDLRNWETIGFGQLNWLSNAERDTLSSDRIDFSPRSFRYARLTWREGAPIEFASVIAEAPEVSTLAAKLDSVTLQARPGSVAGDLVYEGAVAIPVARLGLEFAERNIVMPAVIGEYQAVPITRGNKTTRLLFLPSMQNTFFQLDQAGQLRRSGDLSVGELHQQQWVLRPHVASPSKPALRLAWTPATMVFVASGPGPLTLRFGNAAARAVRMELAQVAPGFSSAEVHSLEHASAGPLASVRQAVPSASAAEAASQAARSRVALLWGALLLGVAVLGLMAWKLMRQMQESPEAYPSKPDSSVT